MNPLRAPLETLRTLRTIASRKARQGREGEEYKSPEFDPLLRNPLRPPRAPRDPTEAIVSRNARCEGHEQARNCIPWILNPFALFASFARTPFFIHNKPFTPSACSARTLQLSVTNRVTPHVHRKHALPFLPAETPLLSPNPPLLSIRDLSVAFNAGKPGEHCVLDRVSLDIAPGEVLGLVGESGSGKTVLSHSILGLLPPNGRVTSGSIRWKGRELQYLSEKELRPIRGKEIAMIFQDPQASLNPVYPVGRQIEWVLKLHRGITGPEAKAEILRLFESVKLRDPDRVARSYPHELSGGMCQRVLISLALACKPKLLIADEPTSALDVSVAAEIVSLLGSLRAEWGLSLLVITHDFGVATRVADRIAVIELGEVIEISPAEHFLSQSHHPSSRRLIDASRYLSGQLAASAP
jgi:ABC-type dipeptide/oligopeptide/nickel transport system ATPase component